MTTNNSTTNDSESSNNTIGIMMKMDDTTTTIEVGGGAINEKKRNFGQKQQQQTMATPTNMPPSKSDSSNGKTGSSFRATTHRAHLLHAIEGLDRYPNYLSRWSLEDTEELERALEQTLEKVQHQKTQVMERRHQMQQLIQRICHQQPSWHDFIQMPMTWDDLKERNILDPQMFNAIIKSKRLFYSSRGNTPTTTTTTTTKSASLQDVLTGESTVELDAGYLEEIMDEECANVYSFPLFTPSFSNQLRHYVRHVMEEMEKDTSSSSSSLKHLNRGMIRDLDNFGLSWLNDLLLHLIIRPISRHLYKETDIQGDLDWRQGFIAAYSHSPTHSKPRQRLVPHTDDAEVTLNIGLGDIFEGGNLNMWGLRGSQDAGTLSGEYQPQIGRALLHAGRHLHEVTEITSGDRYAYIVWTRSWNGGIRSTTCPCCWMNRRHGQGNTGTAAGGTCLCGPRWN